MPSPQISIVIVNWNVRDILRENLARLFSLPCRYEKEVIVIDNGSQDGSARMVREEFPEVRLVMNDWNAGFAYPVNQGLRLSTGEVILLLNPDMLLEEGVLERTYDELMAHPDIGILTVKLTNPEGNPIRSVRRDPGFRDQLAIVLKLPHLFPVVVNRYLYAEFDYETSQNVEQVRGSYFAFRRELFERVGPFDERFFIWFEEVDYCKRVRKEGYRVRYCADVACRDLVGQSFKQHPVRRKQAMLTRSMVFYFWKWHPKWQAAILATLRPLAILMGVGVDLARFLRKRKTV
ncbi:glycosyltransferase family 2 protein [Candidatus Uhrbacteria bacterium]|nr:glycosyltransferase family 2 protein [Candidatus Uhrbacteria bacterium]